MRYSAAALLPLIRIVSFVIAAGFTVLAAAAEQPSARVYRIAHLSGSSESASREFVQAFREGMRALGYIEEKNLRLDGRYADGKVDRLPGLARELIRTEPDVILASTTPGSLAAKAATTSIPIVMVLVADPVGAGIVKSLARPGGNVTGVTNIVAELAGKRLELLREILPGSRRIAVLVNPNSQNAPLQMQHARSAAGKLGVDLAPVLEVRSPDDLEAAFESAARAHAAGAIRMIDPLVFMLRRQTTALAAKYRLPVIYPTREDVEAGGLLAYGADVTEQYRQAATFVDKLLRGAKPAELPVEQPTRFELVINMKTAKALDIVIPPAVMVRATHVIQ